MQAITWSSMQYPFSSTDSAIIKDDNSSISYPCMYLLADAWISIEDKRMKMLAPTPQYRSYPPLLSPTYQFVSLKMAKSVLHRSSQVGTSNFSFKKAEMKRVRCSRATITEALSTHGGRWLIYPRVTADRVSETEGQSKINENGICSKYSISMQHVLKGVCVRSMASGGAEPKKKRKNSVYLLNLIDASTQPACSSPSVSASHLIMLVPSHLPWPVATAIRMPD